MERSTRHWLKALYLCILLYGGLWMTVCSDDQQPVPEPFIQHRDYVKMEKGLTLFYRVDSIVYNDFENTIDTTSFRIIHKVLDKLTDSAGIRQYLVKRSVKGFQSENLLSSSLYRTRFTPETYQRFQNNRRLLALEFPLEAGATWDGNRFNNLDSQQYRVKAIHQPATVLDKAYDSTLLIREEYNENLISLKAQRTRYAKGFGRIYHENINLRFRGDSIPPEDVPWEAKANTGQIVRHRLMKLRESS